MNELMKHALLYNNVLTVEYTDSSRIVSVCVAGL